jgi:hypothetical protein
MVRRSSLLDDGHEQGVDDAGKLLVETLSWALGAHRVHGRRRGDCEGEIADTSASGCRGHAGSLTDRPATAPCCHTSYTPRAAPAARRVGRASCTSRATLAARAPAVRAWCEAKRERERNGEREWAVSFFHAWTSCMAAVWEG